jgi:hypothetical protein
MLYLTILTLYIDVDKILKCSFDFGSSLLNVQWIHNNKIYIKGFDTIDSNSSYLTIPNINHTFSGHCTFNKLDPKSKLHFNVKVCPSEKVILSPDSIFTSGSSGKLMIK